MKVDVARQFGQSLFLLLLEFVLDVLDANAADPNWTLTAFIAGTVNAATCESVFGSDQDGINGTRSDGIVVSVGCYLLTSARVPWWPACSRYLSTWDQQWSTAADLGPMWQACTPEADPVQ